MEVEAVGKLVRTTHRRVELTAVPQKHRGVRESSPTVTSRSARSLRAVTILVASGVIVGSLVSAAGGAVRPSTPTTSGRHAHSSIDILYPTGTPDAGEPSGDAPPGATALADYAQTYVNDFNGTTIPHTWNVFTGVPGGDPSGRWAASHVVVGGGLLQLNTYQDPSAGNAWVSGGVCQCGLTRTYGAYFVRSRVTGAGPTQDELLWPAQGWPPEIDFNESFGDVSNTSATLHFDSSNDQIHAKVAVDLTKWHTWGVIWTPTSVTYTVDGDVWGTVTDAAAISNVPMELDITQQTFCGESPAWACPTAPATLDVDWVDEYAPVTTVSAASTTTTVVPVRPQSLRVGPFRSGSAAVGVAIGSQIRHLAVVVRSSHDRLVRLIGYGDTGQQRISRFATGLARAKAVRRALERALEAIGVVGVRVSVQGRDGSVGSLPLATPRATVHDVVVASIS